jgi:hypothetical protein
MAAGMRTGDKTNKTNMAIENMAILSFLCKADVNCRETSLGKSAEIPWDHGFG